MFMIGLDDPSLKAQNEQRTEVKSLSFYNAVGDTDQQMAHLSGNLFHCTKELLRHWTRFMACHTLLLGSTVKRCTHIYIFGLFNNPFTEQSFFN